MSQTFVFVLYLEQKCLFLLISFTSVLFSDEDKSLQKEYSQLPISIKSSIFLVSILTSYLWPNCGDNVNTFR